MPMPGALQTPCYRQQLLSNQSRHKSYLSAMKAMVNNFNGHEALMRSHWDTRFSRSLPHGRLRILAHTGALFRIMDATGRAA